MLSVADSRGAAWAGVIPNLGVEQERGGFKASLEAAREAGLVLSSKLRLATEVFQ